MFLTSSRRKNSFSCQNIERQFCLQLIILKHRIFQNTSTQIASSFCLAIAIYNHARSTNTFLSLYSSRLFFHIKRFVLMLRSTVEELLSKLHDAVRSFDSIKFLSCCKNIVLNFVLKTYNFVLKLNNYQYKAIKSLQLGDRSIIFYDEQHQTILNKFFHES